jgi:hypothetical protein
MIIITQAVRLTTVTNGQIPPRNNPEKEAVKIEVNGVKEELVVGKLDALPVINARVARTPAYPSIASTV